MTDPAVAETTSSARDVLARLVGWGLVDGHDHEAGQLAAVSVADGEAGTLVDDAVHAGLIGVLSLAADAGSVELGEATRAAVHERQRVAMVWCLRLEAHLLSCIDALADSGIDSLVVKGPAAAHLDTADPSLRPFSDIDLLVRSADLDQAIAVLVEQGATRRWPERRPGFDARFAKSVTLRWPDGIEVDLHRMLADGAYGMRVPEAALFHAPESFVLGGRSVRCLERRQRLLHNAMHLVLGSPTPRAINLRDVVGQLTDPDLEQPAVVDDAMAWRIDAVLAEAVVAVTAAVAPTPAPWSGWADWALSHRPSGRDRAIMERQRAEGSGIGRAKLDALAAMSTWNERVAYGWALATPDRAHRRSHGGAAKRGARP